MKFAGKSIIIILKITLPAFIIAASCYSCQPNGSSEPSHASGSSDSNALPDGVTESFSGNNDSINFGANNRYIVINNEWNLGLAPDPHFEYIFAGTNNGTPFFGWRWSWNNSNSGSVLAYPEVLCGSSPWGLNPAHPADIPFRAGYYTVNTTFDINLTAGPLNGHSAYDMAFDLWVISNNSSPSSFNLTNIKCEIMIWLASENTTPDGLTAPSGSLTANGSTFGFYYYPLQNNNGAHPWIYAAFSSSDRILHKSGGFDITPFLNYLISNNIIDSNDYVCTVELGTEIIIGSGTVVISNYSLTITSNS